MPQVTLQFLSAEDRNVSIFPRPDVAPGAVSLRSLNEFELFRGSGDLSNVSRRILIVSSRDEAVALHRALQEDTRSEVVTKLDDETWALSVSAGNGGYDDGIPTIEDLRDGGEEVTIEGDWVPVFRVAGEPVSLDDEADTPEPGS